MRDKLFMVLLGCKPPNRNVEQHDYFFGIASSISALVPQLRAFWPDAGAGLHADGWREVTSVNGYSIKVSKKEHDDNRSGKKLFFINLGGYLPGKLAEQHHVLLSVNDNKAQAIQFAKKDTFFKTNTQAGAPAHIDDSYAIDVDDIYGIEDILSPQLKQEYNIELEYTRNIKEDAMVLGYYKMNKLAKL